MKISRETLQGYFNTALPSVVDIADAFTFHAFEIDSIEGDVLDVKVLPNRPDCKNEAGVALELSAILNLPMKGSASYEYTAAPVTVSLARINGILGVDFSATEVEDVFSRLHFKVEKEGDVYHVTAPAPRVDIVIPEDVAEEVGQILGYDRVPATELPPLTTPPDQARYRGTERMKDQLVEQGFIEVSTQSFAKKGDVELANPLDKSKPFLRTSLEENLNDALERAKQYAPLVLPPNVKPKLFEVGTVFEKEGEHVELRMTERVVAWGDAAGTVDNLSVAKLEDYGKDYEPKRYVLGAYKPFSLYPFVTRDIAFWLPKDFPEANLRGFFDGLVMSSITDVSAGINFLDRFEKEGKISYAFRLVFQSLFRTLTDEEVNGVMEKISAALMTAGYEIR